ncbi:MAG: hypothetical protein ACW99G_07255 [Candidatus Thorarchaeota archaeon]
MPKLQKKKGRMMKIEFELKDGQQLEMLHDGLLLLSEISHDAGDCDEEALFTRLHNDIYKMMESNNG